RRQWRKYRRSTNCRVQLAGGVQQSVTNFFCFQTLAWISCEQMISRVDGYSVCAFCRGLSVYTRQQNFAVQFFHAPIVFNEVAREVIQQLRVCRLLPSPTKITWRSNYAAIEILRPDPVDVNTR